MMDIHWKVAETRGELDEAQQVRWTCIREELGIAAREETALRRDVCELDVLPNVHHIVVYSGRQPVGTARLVQADASVARATGCHHGFELERQVDLRRLGLPGAVLGEVGRLCVLREHTTRAVARLYEGLYALSRALGIRYWIGGVDCGTADPETAKQLYAELVRCGLISLEWHLGIRCTLPANDTTATRPSRPEGVAQRGRLARVPPMLPHALGSFVRRLNGRAIGAPVAHPYFERYVLPMIADLDAIPDATLALFDSSVTAAFALLRPSCLELIQTAHESLRRLDRHPVGRALIAGTLPKQQYVAYLTQVVHQVRDSAPMLARAAERLEQLGRRRLAEIFLRKSGEENGHDAWALEDLAALGVCREAALSSPRSSAVRAYGAWLRHCTEAAPTAVLGLAFTLELFGSARAARAAENLVRRAPIENITAAVRFLRAHGAADEDHLRAFAEPFAEITDPDEMDAIVLSARLTSNLYLGLLDWAAASNVPSSEAPGAPASDPGLDSVA